MTDKNNVSELDKYLSGFAKYEPIAVLFGGRGCEHAVSVMSGVSFMLAAERCGYPILPIFIDKDGGYFIFTGDIEKLADEPESGLLIPTYPVYIGGESGFFAEGRIIHVRCAVPILHGDFGEDGVVQGALASAKIALIGCDNISGAVCADKAYTKWIAASLGIPTLRSVLLTVRKDISDERLNEYCDIAERELGYPMFVKPCRLGSSVGASSASSRDELAGALVAAGETAERVMIEPELTHKRELECAYFCSSGRLVISEPGEVDAGGDFYSYPEKYSSESRARILSKACVANSISETVIKHTAKLAAALGVSQFARFDYFLASDGKIYFNEVNTIPGMTGGSLYAKMLAECGIDFDSFVRLLLGRTEQ